MVIGLFSCSKEPKPMSRQAIQQIADSLSRIRMQQSDEHARRDLDYRIKIEVKVKADSILNVRLHPADTSKKPQPAIPASPVMAGMHRVGNI